MKRKAGEAILEHHNQYPPMHGIPELRQVMSQTHKWLMYISLLGPMQALTYPPVHVQAVAKHSAAQSGIDVDWQSETLVTVGATEALASAFMGMLNQGDEVRIVDTSGLIQFSAQCMQEPMRSVRAC